jgi:GNAT superfamily N-acetyltransferase
VGAVLLGSALDALRADGWPAVTLWMLEGNARGRAFYERFGFAADGATHDLAKLGAREMRLRAAL